MGAWGDGLGAAAGHGGDAARRGLPTLGPRGDDILVHKTRQSLGGARLHAAFSGEAISSGRPSAAT